MVTVLEFGDDSDDKSETEITTTTKKRYHFGKLVLHILCMSLQWILGMGLISSSKYLSSEEISV